MRILHVIGATVAGGAERVVVDLACHLGASGHSIGIFALSGRLDACGEQMRRQLSDSGVTFRSGPQGRVGFGSLFAYARTLWSFRPDIVHLHTGNTELVHAIVTLGLYRPAARTIHSVQSRPLLHRYVSRVNRGVSIACSAAVASSDVGWAGPVIVIQNGVSFSWPMQSREDQLLARHRLGLDEDSFHAVMVGSMRGSTLATAPKAHDVVLKAWRSSRSGTSRRQLNLVGDGNLRPQLQALASGDPTVKFCGVSSQVSDWLLAADIFVMPSRFEGLPAAGIEALGTGLPVIFSAIPPLLELAPRAAIWVPPGDVAALASAFERAAERGFVGSVDDAGRIRREFGVERMANDYLRYYERLMATPS